MTLQARTPSDPALARMLERHPRVDLVSTGGDGFLAVATRVALEFRQGDWERSILVGDQSIEVRGLVELMDNNPMVCADTVSLPPPAATLGLIALGPICKAGLLLEAPTLLTNARADADEVAAWLATQGYEGDALVEVDERNLDGVLSATAIAAITTPAPGDLDALYDECFGRSFFVQRDETSEWHVGLVAGSPRAVYRLSLRSEGDASLVTVRVMADADGKCGAAQVVHAMNVMAGFEETLGL